MAASSDRFDVNAFVAERPIGGFHVWIVLLAGLAMAVDGYDMLFIGNVLPAVAKGLGVTPSGMTGVLTAQAAAVAVGGFLLSALSERWGRRATLLLSIFAFGAATIASGFCNDLVGFALTRTVAGLFLGGVVPNAVPIVSEYAPAKYKGTLVTLSYVGFAAGGMIGALVSTWLAVRLGWQSAFFAAGAIAVVVALLCLLTLPESVAYRVLHNPADPKIPSLLRRLQPGLALTGRELFHVDDRGQGAKLKTGATSGTDLFRGGRGVLTACLWAIFGLSLISSGLSTFWLPTVLVHMHGATLEEAGKYTAVLLSSSIIATLFYGRVLDHFGYTKVLVASYVLGFAALLSLQFVPWHSALRVVVTVIIGITTLSAQTGLLAFATYLYPIRIKATGVGWAWSFGRGLALLSPLIGGYLFARNISFLGFLLAISLPWILIVALLLVIAVEHSRLRTVEA